MSDEIVTPSIIRRLRAVRPDRPTSDRFEAADEIEKLRERCEAYKGQVAAGAAEIERLRALVLDACQVFDNYDLPEQAFHYRRVILGLDQAIKIARGMTPEEKQEMLRRQAEGWAKSEAQWARDFAAGKCQRD